MSISSSSIAESAISSSSNSFGVPSEVIGMAMVLTDSGALLIAQAYFKKTSPTLGNDFTLRLFTNDMTPANSDTAAMYTEVVGGGYDPIIASIDDFSVALENSVVTIRHVVNSFLFSGPLTGSPSIYGAYITDADGILICAERGLSTYTPAVDGIEYVVTPVFLLGGGTIS